MASGKLDLFIAQLPANTLVLTLNCSDSAADLSGIPDHVPLVIRHGKIKQTVRVETLEGRECFADFMEMPTALALRLHLKAHRRYRLGYQAQKQELVVQPVPINDAIAMISPGTIGQGTVSIGYELLSKLGIPERQRMLLRVRYGLNSSSFRLHVPSNLSDNRLKISAPLLQKWKLLANQPYRMVYDQRNATLLISRRNISST